MDHEKTQYFPELDGIRALAVLLVLFYHLSLSAFGGGFIGVDIFFVLSGYLITKGIVGQLETGSFSFISFYKRRFFRLFPAIIVTVLCVLILGVLILPVEPLVALGRSAQWVIASVGNIHFYKQAGYWDQSSFSKPLLHFWSLSVEEQFYLVWPLLIYLASTKVKTDKRKLVWVLLFFGILSFVMGEISLSKGHSAPFYLMPYRVWEFCIGGILAVMYNPTSKLFSNRTFNSFMSVVALGICLWSALALSHKSTFPGLNAVPTCLATAMLIIFTRNSIAWSLLANKTASYIGKISFSIYLVHWPLIVFYRDLKLYFSNVFSLEDTSLNGIETLALGTATLILASLLRKYVENPFRLNRFRSEFFRARVSTLGITSAVAISILIVVTKGLPVRIDQSKVALGLSDEAEHSCAYRYQDGIWKDGCGIGAVKAHPDIVLLGDSHMGHYWPGFDGLLSRMNLSGLIIYSGGSLPIPNGYSLVMGVKSAPFDDAYKKLLKDPPRLVILSARWDAHFKRQIPDFPGLLPNRFMFGEFQSTEVESSQNAVKTGLRAILAELNKMQIETLVLGQVPLPVKNIKDCLTRPRYFSRFSEACLIVDAKKQISYESTIVAALKYASQSLTHIYFVDMTKELCDEKQCEILSDSGKLIYKDTNHLSDEGGEYVASKYIRPYIEKILKSGAKFSGQQASKQISN